jgi:hypothetical protein
MEQPGLPPLQFVTLEKLPSPVKLTTAAFAGECTRPASKPAVRILNTLPMSGHPSFLAIYYIGTLSGIM